MRSPVGPIQIEGTENYISKVNFVAETKDDSPELPVVIKECKTQLEEYFAGGRKVFSVKLSQQGTAFQQRVWDELMNIPFGKTISYLQLAKNLGDAKCIRAAGTANGHNNIAIIVPCHRVIGSNGTLVGYAGGLDKKKWLLDFEASITGQQMLDL